MTKYEDIKGASELVNKYKEEFGLIDDSLNKLRERKKELEDEIGNDSERFTMESIEKNAKTKQELNQIKQYIKEAETQKENLIHKTHLNSYNEVVNVLKGHRKEVWNKHEQKNHEIINLLERAESIYNELLEEERAENRKGRAFIREMQPYLADRNPAGSKIGGNGSIISINRDALTGSGGVYFHRVPDFEVFEELPKLKEKHNYDKQAIPEI